MEGGDILDKAEIALELTKLISVQVATVEYKTNGSKPNYPKALADAYNKIFDTIHISDTNEK